MIVVAERAKLLAERAKEMKDSASFEPKMIHPEQVSESKPDEKPWLRQKNEPALWFMRFKRYRDMGAKRSLRAVVASEPPDAKGTKGNKKQATKSEGVTLSTLSVPGAWSRAAKVWNWKERAGAYDLAELEKQAGYMRQVVVHQPFASKAYRLIYLCGMAQALHKLSEFGLSLDENLKYAKLIQSLFQDIAHEMEGMDETTMMLADASAHKHLIELANKQKAQH
jgi:hypothetical protein